MTADVIDIGLKSASFILSIAAMVFAWVRTRRKDVDGRLHEGSKRMDSLDARIADRLGLSERTIETHRKRIMDKLQLRGVAELTKYAIREGITSLDG